MMTKSISPLRDVSVDIPIYDVGAGRSLRSAVLDPHRSAAVLPSQGLAVIVNALKNISIEARDGDRIALVGNNGSGKSTLLRVLSEVYPPTRGQVEVNGRISPMFDATLGMSMDATGMENIRICGRLWGRLRNQVENQRDGHRGIHGARGLPVLARAHLLDRHDAAARLFHCHGPRARDPAAG